MAALPYSSPWVRNSALDPSHTSTALFPCVLNSNILRPCYLLSFYIGRAWESQFSSKTAAFSLEDITRYCMFPTSIASTMGRCGLRTDISVAPILDDIPLTYTLTPFNGSLLRPTIHRGDASPSVDAAWEALGANYRTLTIPSHLAARSGLTSSHVHISSKYGGGYLANVKGCIICTA
jgi:hypothetical protein